MCVVDEYGAYEYVIIIVVHVIALKANSVRIRQSLPVDKLCAYDVCVCVCVLDMNRTVCNELY